VLLREAHNLSFEELLECIVSVLGSIDYLLDQVLLEFILAGVTFRFIKKLDPVSILAVLIDLVLQGRTCKEVVEDKKSIIHKIFVANRNKQVFFKFGEDLKPFFSMSLLI
jgi:hypothetical protein